MTMYLVILLTVVPYIHTEMFTSMADMERMVISEKRMVTELKNYVTAEEKKLADVKNFMTRLNNVLRNVNASQDVGTYLGNPVNSYLMLKRFNVDWKLLEKMLEADLAENFNTMFGSMKPYFPTNEDHLGAMDALLRLQTVYKLQARSLVNGFIPGVGLFSRQPLSIRDTFELGARAYNQKKWRLAMQWLNVVLEELGELDVVNDVLKSDVLDYLAYTYYQVGEFRRAYWFNVELSKFRPNDRRVLDNLAYFERELKNLEKRGELGNDEVYDENGELAADESMRAEMKRRDVTKKNYEKLCRGESRTLSRKEIRRLKCWIRQNNPMLRLKPQKVERVWVKPEIFLFHDIVTDRQVKWIQDTAYPRLQRAVIQDPQTDELKIADYRISKSAWLSPKHHAEVRLLQKRAQAVTGLDMNAAEQLQIADYGIGGQYEPHFDHATGNEDEFTELNMGNRIATLLFYLSDVEAGGATVFTRALGTFYPRKNAAVFWYNLKRNGKSNDFTKHAGCPVLVGHKSISNWWIHEFGQEFRRKCALNKNW